MSDLTRSDPTFSQWCTFCNLGNLALWHVIGNVYTCKHCAEKNKLKVKELRKVEVK